MVHGQHGVLAAGGRGKCGIGGHRAAQPEPLGPQPFEGRCDDIVLLAAQVPALAGMRVQSAHEDLGLADAEFPAQVCVENAQDSLDECWRNVVGNVAQRQMRAR